MSSQLAHVQNWRRILSGRRGLLVASAAAVVCVGVVFFATRAPSDSKPVEVSSQSKRSARFTPSEAQWASLGVETVQNLTFHAEQTTEGKIAVDEDRATPIFSPYAGRVTKLLAKPGDTIERGQPLFTVEATDMVQAQNDFITAATVLNKAYSALNLAQIIDKRQRELYDAKAVPLKEVQNARAALDAAENDVRSSEVGVEAGRNRLRILGKTDKEISDFQQKGVINPATPIYAPIGGTIVQRKVGPGQYIGPGASDPVFVLGDLSSVWLTAFVRETEASDVRVGQPVSFTVLAYPHQVFHANINYVSASLDSNTRRLVVRATVHNDKGLLKPEMFASVNIYTSEGDAAPAIPRQSVIYEGDTARVWIVNNDKSIELRQLKLGLVSGKMIQVLDGLKVGEKVITKGTLFIDRASASS